MKRIQYSITYGIVFIFLAQTVCRASDTIDDLTLLEQQTGTRDECGEQTITKFVPASIPNTVVFNNVLIEDDEFIKGNITVGGSGVVDGDLTVNGTITAGGSNFVTGPSSSTPDAVPRYADNTGKVIKDSSVLVDDAGNITIAGITNNGNTVSWPPIIGPVNTFLASDGAGNLIYATPAGGGNVTAAAPFAADNRIVRTDLPSGSNSIQQSGITLDDTNNITGVNALTATTINTTTLSSTTLTGNLTGNVTGDVTGNITGNVTGNVTGNLAGNATTATTATNFTGSLSGDVTGTQSATVVSSVGGQTAANVAAGTVLANNATASNTPNTLVKRDGSGNFSANNITASLIGAASLNVLKTGDSMTGTLNMAGQSETRWQDAAGGEYVGFRAPTTIPTSYTLDLPPTAPTSGQFLQATSASATQWATVGGAPAVSKTYYVAKNGNDSNDGSLSAPFLTISHAVSVANTVASFVNPIAIQIGAGIFVENNSGGPITVTANGINILGSSISGTIIIPQVLSIDLFRCTTPNILFSQFGIQAGGAGSTASGISVISSTPGIGRFASLDIRQFQTGINISTGGAAQLSLENIQALANTTGISLNNASAALKNSIIVGSLTGSPVNTGISVTGSSSGMAAEGVIFGTMNTGVSISGGGRVSFIAGSWGSCVNGIIVSGGSTVNIVGYNFTGNLSNTVNIQALDVGTTIAVTGCSFQCASGSIARGTVLQSTTGATIRACSCSIDGASVAIACGTTGDTDSTTILADSVALTNCTTDAVQVGTSTLHFLGGVFALNKVTIADSTNVSFAAFDKAILPAHLAIGNTIDETQNLYQVLNSAVTTPTLTYEPDYYGSKGTIYKNPTNDATCNGTQAINNDASYFVVTQDRTKQAGIDLISDTGNVGNPDNVRGWSINKLGTSADLSFNYSNNDTSGQAARGSNPVMMLNGFDNQVEFPTATNTPLPTNTEAKLIWGGDTNLYRSAAGILQTDGNLIVSGLTANRALTTNASDQLTSSSTTDTELGYLAGTTSSVQTQINGKVAKSGDIMTGALQVPAGTTSTPSLNFTGSTTTGLSAATTDTLSVSTAGMERMKISSAGVLSVNGLNAAGVVHTDSSGNFSTSTIVNADVSASAAISDTKLGPITTAGKVANSATTATNANTPSAIVARDVSGNFTANTITANLTGNISGTAASATNFTGLLSGDVTGTQTATVVSIVGGQTAANVASATTAANAATDTNTASTIVKRDASGNFSATTVTADLIGNVTGSLSGNATSATTATTATNFTGSLSGDVTGTQSATVVSTVGGQTAANVAAGSVLANAATANNTASTIVKRDASNNFSAGIITATLTGSASLNVLKAGDTMTGALQVPTGTTSTPSLNFTGSPTTGLSAATDTLSLSTAGTERLKISAAGVVTIDGLNTAGVVHTDASGVLSTSAIVNADVSASAAIADTKLGPITTAGKVANSATTATSANTASAIVARDSSNNFSAGIITADLVGNVTGNVSGSAGSATNFTGSLSGDVTGTQSATVVATVGGQTAADIAATTVTVNAATDTNTPSTIVKRDALGNFVAGTITANLTGTVTGSLSGNATSATTATTATNFTGSLVGDVTGTQGATVVNSVGGQTAANVAAGSVLANAATANNTASAIVRRDGSGNFSAGIITANSFVANVTTANNFIGDLTGDVTGNLFGNATTATSATTATTATNFTGSLSGDVTGTQSATVVATVGGQTAANVAAATVLANNATATNNANTIVKRDSSGNFNAGMISLSGTVTNPTDVTTKTYVDNAIATGFTVHDPAVVVSTGNITLSGLQTIDGVALATNNRVLLIAQTNPVQNGLWLSQTGAWTRPTDFASGTEAGTAYVLITSGTTNAGTSWVCNTPTAIIDTDPIMFAQFSLASQTTAANVGGQTGQLFRDKTGNTLNFKTIGASDAYTTITNNTNDISIGTNGTSSNTATTLVARDSSGNFSATNITASLIGAASLNVLKSGDTMTGNLNMAAQSETRWQDAAGGEYVGFRAPTTIPTSYTIDLPTTAPTTGQFLQATSASATQWATVGGAPSASKTYYVAKNGNDSNDGSLSSPFLTIGHAASVANTVSSALNPVVIQVGAGIFTEDNSGGPIGITAAGISIVGSSTISTIITPSTAANTLFSCTTASVQFADLTLSGSVSSTASAISLVTNVAGRGGFTRVSVNQFQTGFSLSSAAGVPVILFDSVQVAGNTTSISASNIRTIIRNSVFAGPVSGSTPANTGISMTGATTVVAILGSIFNLMQTAITATGGSTLRVTGSNIVLSTNGVVASGASKAEVVGCDFSNNNASSININGSGAGTTIAVTGCSFQCATSGVSQGTAVQSTTGASVLVNSSSIDHAVIAIACGTTGDTSTTSIVADSVALSNCTTDIVQVGSSSLNFVGGVFSANKVTIANPTNISFTAFDINTLPANLSIGDTTDDRQTLYEVLNSTGTVPTLTYEPSYYGKKGTIYENPTNDATCNGTQATNNDASYFVVTQDRTKQAGITLISDTSAVGNGDNVRGWDINKSGTSASLSFNYSNTDTSGQAARGSNPVITLNGFDNQVEFPTATNTPLPTNTEAKLVWGGDTTLYRSAAGILKTDGNLIVAGLTANRALTTNASDQLTSSSTTDTELGYLSGTTSSVQTQINSKVAKAGDVMTGALQLPAGTTSTPSLNFTGSTTTGLSAATVDTLSFSTAGAERMKISSTGIISVDGLNAAGVVHTDASGNFSTSQIVNTDVSASAGIVDTKLATISSAGKVANSATTATNTNTSNAIVSRDALGNFSAGTITANLTGNVTGSATSATNFTGSLSGDVTGTQSATVVSTVGGQTAANVASATVAANAATASNTPSTIVKRDGTGNFSAGTITASITGAASLNVLKSGDSMTGALQLAPGTTSTPSLNFTSSPTTGLSAATADTLSISTAGAERMKISSAGVVSIDGLNSAGVVHTDASGNLSTSTIVNADVSNTAAIADTKLATISTAGKVANSATTATSANTPSALVTRDSTGNFSAGTITASLTGNATTATSATNFTGSLSGDVTGTQSATVVSLVGGQTAANVASATVAANAATASNTPSTIVKRDGTGNFSAGTITANLTGNVTGNLSGNATSATSATNFSGSLSGDVTGTQSATVVSSVGGQTAANVASATSAANAATSTNTASTIVKRDGSGNFAAGVISSDLIGNVTGSLTGNATSATTATTATNFTGSLAGDVTGTQSATVVSSVGGQTAANVAAGTVLANAATANNTASAIVRRDGSGNFSAGTITASVTGAASLNVLKAGDTMTGALQIPAGTTSVPALKFTGSTTTGLSAATVDTLSLSTAGSERMKISSAGVVSINGLNAAGVVHTDSSGNLSTSTIVNADVSNTAAIADTKLATISTAGKVANSATTATNVNTASTIVARDASGNFSAGTITAALTGAASLNVLKAGDTMTGTLILPAGTTASPSLQFTGSTNTGITAQTANTLSFDTSGAERMNISDTAVNTIAALVVKNVYASQATQVFAATANNQTVTVTSGISLLLLTHAAARTGLTVTFPPSPIDGQIFTIMLGTTNSITFTAFNGGTGGATVVSAFTGLNPASAPAANSNGNAVTYMYVSSLNSWFRYSRG